MMSSKSELTKTIETQQTRITRLEQRLAGLFKSLIYFINCNLLFL